MENNSNFTTLKTNLLYMLKLIIAYKLNKISEIKS